MLFVIKVLAIISIFPTFFFVASFVGGRPVEKVVSGAGKDVVVEWRLVVPNHGSYYELPYDRNVYILLCVLLAIELAFVMTLEVFYERIVEFLKGGNSYT